VYQTLLSEHRTLQTNFDDVVSEKEDVQSRLRELERTVDNRRMDSRGDAMLRGEVERLRSEL
jgi:protein HOOK3